MLAKQIRGIPHSPRNACNKAESPVASRRARNFFDQISTQPVRGKYLKSCIAAYKPPSFKGLAQSGKRRPRGTKRAIEAELWFVSGLQYREVPEAEEKLIEAASLCAERKLKRPEESRVDFVHYTSRPAYFNNIRTGDWIVSCVSASNGRKDVWGPEQILSKGSYPRGNGKRRYFLMLEEAKDLESMPLSQFRRKVRKVLPVFDRSSPHTRPIGNNAHADRTLTLWTAKGKVSRPP